MSTTTPAVSVVLCTYNRADQLASALEPLLAQSGDVPYELLVVDNNSKDRTADVVNAAARQARTTVRYLFEPKQGLSHARNRGIDEARAPIVAFTDDDVRVADDWVASVARAFDRHPDADYVGGRVLPNWLQPPPKWLTTAHWSPLALQDYGDEPLVSSRDRAVCLVGASLSFRREVFERVGLFAPRLGRIKDGIGSTEDHDMQLRLWKAGMRGVYVPDVVSIADVTPDRMVKAYHRRWHRGHGRYCAAMRLRELVPEDLGPMSEPADIVSLFGSPAYVYADLLVFGRRWLLALIKGEDSFFYANKVRHIWSYLRAGYADSSRCGRRGVLTEVSMFAEAYWRKVKARRMVA